MIALQDNSSFTGYAYPDGKARRSGEGDKIQAAGPAAVCAPSRALESGDKLCSG